MVDDDARTETGGNEGSQRGKQRSPGMVVVLTLVTLGLYGAYWLWSVTKEMDRFDPYRKSPFDIVKWALPVTFGGMLGYLAGFFTVFGGAAAGSEAGIGMGIIIFGIAVLAVFVGGIAMLVAQWRLWSGVETHERSIGARDALSPILMLILLLVPFVNMIGTFYVYYRVQKGLNRIWTAAEDGYEPQPPERAGGFDQQATGA